MEVDEKILLVDHKYGEYVKYETTTLLCRQRTSCPDIFQKANILKMANKPEKLGNV